MQKVEKFPFEVQKELKYYVYRLIDPRNGQTFYIGKGKGNRVFEHVNLVIKNDNIDNGVMSLKNETITQIRNIKDSDGTPLEPIHIIHRHGLDEDTALAVEAALIDLIGDLTNEVKGHGSSQFGPANIVEIINRYSAEILEVQPEHKLLAISINKSIDEKSIYDAVRYQWKINKKNAEKADYVLAIQKGICKGVFVAEKWLPSADTEFSNFFANGNESLDGRYAFIGYEAPKEIEKLYLNKRLPDNLAWKQGQATPFKYFYSDSRGVVKSEEEI